MTGGIPIAILAHALIAVSLLWDKILLRRPETRNLANYVFWLGAMSVLGGFVMFGAEQLNLPRVLPSVLWSALLFGLTNVVQKIVFNDAGFVTGYVFFTLGISAGMR